MTKHEILVKKAIDAIEKVFNDTSVSKEQTAKSLDELKEQVEGFDNALACDTSEEPNE